MCAQHPLTIWGPPAATFSQSPPLNLLSALSLSHRRINPLLTESCCGPCDPGEACPHLRTAFCLPSVAIFPPCFFPWLLSFGGMDLVPNTSCSSPLYSSFLFLKCIYFLFHLGSSYLSFKTQFNCSSWLSPSLYNTIYSFLTSGV